MGKRLRLIDCNPLEATIARYLFTQGPTDRLQLHNTFQMSRAELEPALKRLYTGWIVTVERRAGLTPIYRIHPEHGHRELSLAQLSAEGKLGPVKQLEVAG